MDEPTIRTGRMSDFNQALYNAIKDKYETPVAFTVTTIVVPLGEDFNDKHRL